MDSTMSVGIVSVATNRYVDYWGRLAESVDRHLFGGHEVVLNVFTDRITDVSRMAATLKRVHVNPVEIGPLGWPLATLLRYEVFDTHRDQLQQDLLVHLDADMLVAADTGAELSPRIWDGGIGLVRHPGYRRPARSARARLYAAHPGIAARDVYSKARYGGIGRWETDPESRAFVPRSQRSTYVCGGTWFGLREPLLAMIHELAVSTRDDLDHDRIAVWHDESHLNRFASLNRTALLDSSYCYAEGLPGLADLSPRIVAVDKNDDRTR